MAHRARTCMLSLVFLAGLSSALDIAPNTIVRSVAPMVSYGSPIDSVRLSNSSNAAISVDSVVIRFLNGDSADFGMGADCEPGQFYDYNYRGWVYGMTSVSLRYLSDSLFLLQDSAGNRITFTVGAQDSRSFVLQLIVNCPLCARMPLFPKTTDFLYLFYSSGTPDSVRVTVYDQTSTRMTTANRPAFGRSHVPGHRFTIAGQALRGHQHVFDGVIVDDRSGVLLMKRNASRR